MLAITLLMIWLFTKRKIFAATFNGDIKFSNRLLVTAIIVLTMALFAFKINNSFAETSSNRYNNELSKAGVYSFFAAFKNNELSYDQFYKLIKNEEAFSIIRNELKDAGTVYLKDDLSVKRHITDSGKMIKPNVIMITVESLSADFLKTFGNTQGITPVLDSLAQKSVLFTNLYATGTRTVRGMEALSLAISPTPGSSIVRRPNNDSLFTIGHIFEEQGYETGFFYGGDGYFDNMNQFFGSNGYAVTDRSRSLLATDNFKAPHHIIPDSLVNFENAWGICDEDLYSAVIRDADATFKEGKLFYDFVMTTSNHKHLLKIMRK